MTSELTYTTGRVKLAPGVPGNGYAFVTPDSGEADIYIPHRMCAAEGISTAMVGTRVRVVRDADGAVVAVLFAPEDEHIELDEHDLQMQGILSTVLRLVARQAVQIERLKQAIERMEGAV